MQPSASYTVLEDGLAGEEPPPHTSQFLGQGEIKTRVLVTRTVPGTEEVSGQCALTWSPSLTASRR